VYDCALANDVNSDGADTIFIDSQATGFCVE
jgi:hypothetical protein